MTGLIIFYIIITLLVLFSAFLPFPICTLFWLVTYTLIIISVMISLICLIGNIIRKKSIKNYVVFLIISIISFLIYNSLYNLERCFIEVDKYMKKNYTDYKILGIEKKKIQNKNSEYGSYISCEYMLNVKLNDESNIIFQSGYCSYNGIFANYKVMDNYAYYYIPYYYDKYKINNNVSFTIEKEIDKYNKNNIKLIYNDNNKNEVYSFIKYLFENTSNKNYSFAIYNESNDIVNYVSSWNNEYEYFFKYR